METITIEYSKSRQSVYFNSKLMCYIFRVQGRVSVYLRFGSLLQLLAAPVTVIKAFTVLRGSGCVKVGMQYILWNILNTVHVLLEYDQWKCRDCDL